MKRVHYNGHTEFIKSCQPHTDLTGENARWGIGYEVVDEINLSSQINYVLKDIKVTDNTSNPGYNSNWFKEVPVRIGNSHCVPKVGEILTDFCCFDKNGNQEIISQTSPVIKVHSLSKDVYEVYTQDYTYIVQISR